MVRFCFVATQLQLTEVAMFKNHEQLSAYLDQARSRSSLVEVLVHKGDRLSDVVFGRVASASPHGVELNLRGAAGVTIYFDFCDADIQHCRREKPSQQGWRVQSPGGMTLIFFELPQHQIAA
jgi:hypothetical protein